MSTDDSRSALEGRPREAARAVDLRVEDRLAVMIDYGSEALERRLRTVVVLQRACLVLGRAVPVPDPVRRTE